MSETDLLMYCFVFGKTIDLFPNTAKIIICEENLHTVIEILAICSNYNEKKHSL